MAAGTWGVQVRSLASHDTLVDINGHRLLTPASTLKTITLAVAADRLGWDFTYETRAVASGRIENGALDGDLVIVGDGDPSLDDWDGQATTVFQSWAAHLKEIGVSAITGRIVGDDRAFADDGLGSGWAWDDMAFAYSTPASALQFNQGAAQIVITPSIAGTPAVLSIQPAYARVALRGTVMTDARGSATAITTRPAARGERVRIGGSIAEASTPQLRNVAVANPTQYFVSAVKASLQSSGIDVRGDAVDIDDLADPPPLDGAPLMSHRSPPLSSLADTLMKLSQNMYAEHLLRTLARHAGEPGTAEAGRRVVRDTLAAWGVPPGETLITDGSGLSRYNLVTANALVSVLEHVYGDDRLRAPYVTSLPVAGEAGTLAERLKGTVAAGNAHAKTGSFSNARSVAGFISTVSGEPLAFAIVANNYGVPPDVVDRTTDAIMLALAQFSRD
jgi:D-alanyl-D-alanine carboxypeptidase/D-alanyl-D-alanine-endopeptidase (penicillin-binding protein 4)